MFAPNKATVFGEMFRLLRPGGRVAISDIALKQTLPDSIRQSMEAYVGCVAGAILIDRYRQMLCRAGLQSVVVSDTGADLNAYADAGVTESACCGGPQEGAATVDVAQTGCCGPAPHQPPSLHNQLSKVLASFDANAYAASVRIHALKAK
jgi:hypothetical protein